MFPPQDFYFFFVASLSHFQAETADQDSPAGSKI
jgi:hypothetical protein